MQSTLATHSYAKSSQVLSLQAMLWEEAAVRTDCLSETRGLSDQRLYEALSTALGDELSGQFTRLDRIIT